MKLQVLTINGEASGREIELPADVFAIEPNEHVVYLAVKQYNANQRQGTHKAKERNEIAGSTRKIKRQKGTGTARAGSIKSPVFRGGGRIFGPKPRNYSQALNKKVKDLARKSVLSVKASAQEIIVVEDFNFDAPNTKNFINVLNSLKLADKKSLMMFGEANQNVYLSSRNLTTSNVIVAKDFNVHEVLKANVIVISESAVASLTEVFNK